MVILVRRAQKTELKHYLNTPRKDRNAKLDVISFYKRNQFWYRELAFMVPDVLSNPISIVPSKSTFSVGDYH